MTRQKQTNFSLMLLIADSIPGISESRRHSSEINPVTFSLTARDQKTMGRNGGQSLISRRPRCQRLAPLQIAGCSRATAPLDWGEGRVRGRVEEEDVVEGGRELFYNFVHQQAETEGAEVVRILRVLTPTGYRNPELACIGRELRCLAQTLVNSPERKRMKRKALEMNPNITYADFKDLLTELFAAGGITKERIAVLFFFCYDVALRSLSSRGSEVCSQFLQWSLSFISDSVCTWVRSHGGWGEVMSTRFSKLSISLILAGVILLGYGVIKYVSSS